MRRTIGLLVLLSGCGDSGGPEAPRADYYVNQASGNDANTGQTPDAAFRTITRALTVADSGDTVQVAPGTYDAALGEVFPLTLAAWVTLVGDEPNKGGGNSPTRILGGDTVLATPPIISTAIRPSANSVVAGFTIIDSASALANPTGIYVVTSNVTARNNRISGSIIGLQVRVGGAALDLIGNIFSNNIVGVDFTSAGANSRVEGNTFTANEVGVGWSSPVVYVDMGGGTASSAGNNILSCNTGNDIWVNNVGTIAARNNSWDHVPPGVVQAAGAADIYNGGGNATIDTVGAKLAANACP